MLATLLEIRLALPNQPPRHRLPESVTGLRLDLATDQFVEVGLLRIDKTLRGVMVSTKHEATRGAVTIRRPLELSLIPSSDTRVWIEFQWMNGQVEVHEDGSEQFKFVEPAAKLSSVLPAGTQADHLWLLDKEGSRTESPSRGLDIDMPDGHTVMLDVQRARSATYLGVGLKVPPGARVEGVLRTFELSAVGFGADWIGVRFLPVISYSTQAGRPPGG